MGYEHFRDLLWRSFFQEVEFDEFSGNVRICKMHDCMHDLAKSIAGTRNVMLSLNDANNKIDKKTFHVSVDFSPTIRDLVQQFSTSADHATRIRTMFSTIYYDLQSIDGLFDFGLKFLRTLDLHGSTIKTLPNSIGNMKHLRYLDLSSNGKIEALPDSLTSGRRHYYFCIEASYSGELNELENLNNLRGQLRIEVKKDGVESKAANLRNKQNLDVLELKIGSTIVDNGEGFLPHSNLKELTLSSDHIHLCVPLLICVPSLRNLVRFCLMDHKECQYPPPLNHLPCLKALQLENLPALEYISSNNDKTCFSSLQELMLSKMLNLNGWWKLDVIDIESNASLAANITTIPFFPCLSTLYIRYCPKLISMPLYPCLVDLTLRDASLNSFYQTSMMINEGGQTSNQASSSISTSPTHLASDIQPLSKLEIMRIEKVKLQFLPDQGFKSLASLKRLIIEKCGPLQSLSPGIQHLTSLQKLEIQECEQLDMSDAAMWRNLGSLRNLSLWRLPKLVALPEGLQQVTSLQRIEIAECNNLVDIMECISSLKSLESLEIVECLSLRSLPEGIDCLPSLQTLQICRCLILLERCRKDTADYWPKICNIKELELDPSPEGMVY
ncbi:hypothetical protein FNV43_RR20862 [Rhamnella rubrinervis]|uniref:Uncharacterized protein n=1 Tax=Rhamnella rubrinervis TaxID=2594499 RepID=A0A8K0E0K4_9ROSA|nr:hypothetical protein FNV43_RR20862 [Rhamnella rubrinervis]